MRPSVLIVPLLVAAAACSRGDSATAEPPVRRISVEVQDVSEQPLSPRITATGIVGGKEEVTLSFKIGGVISRIAAEEGATVRAGAVLAELAPVEISSEVAKAREGREKAQRDFVRARTLYTDSVATLEQLQDATTALQVAEQNVRIAEFNLRYASIVAPATGVVLRRMAEPGQFAAPGSAVLLLRTAQRGLVMRAGVADRDVVRLREGDRAEVALDAFPDRRFAARVSQIAAAASPSTGTYEVELSLGAEAASLATGLVGRATIAARSLGRYPVIPFDALLEAEGDSASVFVVAPGRDVAERRRVTIAQLDGKFAAISSGIAAGERVIVRGAAYVDEGTRLAIAGAERATRVP